MIITTLALTGSSPSDRLCPELGGSLNRLWRWLGISMKAFALCSTHRYGSQVVYCWKCNRRFTVSPGIGLGVPVCLKFRILDCPIKGWEAMYTGLTSRRRPLVIYVCRFIVVTFIGNLKLGKCNEML